MLFYRCTDLERPAESAHQDEDEFVVPQTFTLEAARGMVARGEIADMKTVVGLMYLGVRL
jgi:hypothetical protein